MTMAKTPTQGSMTSSMMQAPKMETSEEAAMGRCSSKKLTNSRDSATRAVTAECGTSRLRCSSTTGTAICV